ncbi:MAG: trimethylamine methyltransferase family protein [Chloroflexota bacterium]|nr:MAG: trimethylamine methyltransferase family protein [Chloroflexota bacterium]
MEVLERTGVRLCEQEALDLLKKTGVSPSDGNRVRIPAGLVEKARMTAPNKVTFYNRHGQSAMPVYGHRSFYGPGSDCLHVPDLLDGDITQQLAAIIQRAEQ